MSPRGRTAIGAFLLVSGACAGEPDDATPTPALALPSGTDVWLAELTVTVDGTLGLVALKNVTNREGYDNQPAFTPDGQALLYTRIDGAGQADTWRYDLETDSLRPVTRTAPESEYSPTPVPNGDGFSAVRVEADSTQRLWRFDWGGENARVLLEDVAPVGYHAWADASTLALFVLGQPPTLQVADPTTGKAVVEAENIGRSLQPIPGTAHVSFVQRVSDQETWIHRLDPASGSIEPMVRAVDAGDFHAWTPRATLIMASGGRLYTWTDGADGWTLGVDLSALGISVSRIAVSPSGSYIALVAEPAADGP